MSNIGIITSSSRQNAAGYVPPTGSQRTAQILNLPLAAGAQVPFMVPGDNFYMIVATAPVIVQTIGNASTPGLANYYSQGTGLRVAPGSEFSSLLVTNKTSQPQVISLFIGFGEYIDKRLIIAGSAVQAVAYPTYKNPGGTEATIPIVDLSGQSFTDINGNVWLAINRVSLQMTNYAAATDYILQKAGSIVNNGPGILGVLARTSLLLQVSGNYSISNGGGVNNLSISEIYNAIPPSLPSA